METLEGTRKTNYALVITKLASTLNQHNNNNNQYRKIIITEWQKEKDPVKEYPRKKLNSVFIYFITIWVFIHVVGTVTSSSVRQDWWLKGDILSNFVQVLLYAIICQTTLLSYLLPLLPCTFFILILPSSRYIQSANKIDTWYQIFNH